MKIYDVRQEQVPIEVIDLSTDDDEAGPASKIHPTGDIQPPPKSLRTKATTVRKWDEGGPEVRKAIVVCALPCLEKAEDFVFVKKSKGKREAKEHSRGTKRKGNKTKPLIVEANVADSSDEEYLPMYVQTGDGEFQMYPVAVDELSDCSEYDYSAPDVPMSPCFAPDEWNPKEHCFLLRRRGKEESV